MVYFGVSGIVTDVYLDVITVAVSAVSVGRGSTLNETRTLQLSLLSAEVTQLSFPSGGLYVADEALLSVTGFLGHCSRDTLPSCGGDTKVVL